MPGAVSRGYEADGLLRYSPAVTETAAIVFERVSVARGGRPILNGVDLTLERGETVALVGRSGAGKSTILKLVNRLLTPDAGRILVSGRPTTELGSLRSAPERRLRPPGNRALPAHEHRREHRRRPAPARVGRSEGRPRGCGSCWS